MNKIVLLFLLISTSIFSQVKIGDNPSVINASSILELESTDKALVLTRVSTAQMNAITPLHGAMVYNTDEKCMFVFEGSVWKNLCNNGIAVTTATVAPTINNEGDFWIDNSSNRDVVSVWDGTTWVSINNNPKSGVGEPTVTSNLLAGDIYVNETTGFIYTFNGSEWVNVSGSGFVFANNGITKTDLGVIQLGGTLIKPIEITTTATNTFALNGLDSSTTNSSEVEFLVIDKETGVLKAMDTSNIVTEEEIIVIATNGQLQFTPPQPITDTSRIDVYRNGVRIKFTALNETTIELEPEAVCYENDEIRIVQIY